MRFLIDIALAIVIATTVGFGTAWYAVGRDDLFDTITVGNWTASPTSGTSDADPYAVARLAREAELPLGASEGISFAAETDASGQPLAGNCVYQVTGQTPAAQLWTLTAYDGSGRLMSNPAGRSELDSRELIRLPDGSFQIEVGTAVRPGNWLPVAPGARFKLLLRLYDTPVTTGNAQATDLVMPAIRRESCG